MRSKMIFGALLVSVALCSQGFGFEFGLFGGHKCGDCSECKACNKVAPCEKACTTCAPACEQKRLPQLPAECKECKKHCTPVRDLFDNIADMFEAKAVVVEPVCETKCCPTTCAKPCDKACGCAKPCDKACCAPTCAVPCPPKPKCHKLYRRPLLEMIDSLFGNNECCMEEACGGCNGTTAPKAPAKDGKVSPAPAPTPTAPKADPSTSDKGASTQRATSTLAARSLVRN
jgi:hypothetical protein